ncbi:hypothetical protein KDV48_13965 [Citrobacter sedlakii]|uniref:hypothetical protein n=1 Tax=Citrobacter sedlakii TaxID=67826 RepID=UPI00333D773B
MHLFTNFICPGSVIGVGQKNGRRMAKTNRVYRLDAASGGYVDGVRRGKGGQENDRVFMHSIASLFSSPVLLPSPIERKLTTFIDLKTTTSQATKNPFM